MLNVSQLVQIYLCSITDSFLRLFSITGASAADLKGGTTTVATTAGEVAFSRGSGEVAVTFVHFSFHVQQVWTLGTDGRPDKITSQLELSLFIKVIN